MKCLMSFLMTQNTASSKIFNKVNELRKAKSRKKNTKKKREVWKQHPLKQKTVEPMNHTNLLFSERLDLTSLNKYNALQNVSIYYIWRNIRQQYKNKLKTIAPT